MGTSNSKRNKKNICRPACISKNEPDQKNLFESISPLRLTKREAELLLDVEENEVGTFILRQFPGSDLVLSVLDRVENIGIVRNFRIRKTQNERYYITPKNMFSSLDELIAFYSNPISGLKTGLKKPLLKNVSDESHVNIQRYPSIGNNLISRAYLGLWRNKLKVVVENVNESNGPAVIEIMRVLEHKNILRLLCACIKEKPFFIVTEYMVNGNLLELLRNDSKNKIGFKEIIDMATQIADGMKYLESKKYVHRDLAARNILVGESNLIKISDFSMAHLLDENSEGYKLEEDMKIFPIRWSAPELFYSDIKFYTIKCDVWSFGILLYELITKGAVPYLGMSNQQVLAEIKTNKYRMAKPDGLCTDDYYNIMQQCWLENSTSRPTFSQLFNTFENFKVNEINLNEKGSLNSHEKTHPIENGFNEIMI